jgi:hypothetical protein
LVDDFILKQQIRLCTWIKIKVKLDEKLIRFIWSQRAGTIFSKQASDTFPVSPKTN